MPIAPPPKPIAAPPAAAPTGKKQPDIVVIPDKYYGMALKMDAMPLEEAKPTPPPPPPKPTAPVVMPPERKSPWPMIGIILVLMVLVAGGFVYFARDLLFPKPAPEPIPTPIVKQPPSSPANVSAQSVGTSAISLAWTDTTGDETGYRIERKEGTAGTYLAITSIPANSVAFLDVSAQAGKSYSYRVIAIGEGGESAPSNEAAASLPEPIAMPAPAPGLPPGGLDSDSDGLSDAEERMLGTSETKPDSDNDRYLDGNEVFHLYNPTTPAPSRLVDSQLIKVLTSPAGYSLFVPATWSSGLDTPDGTKATLSLTTGEQFRIAIEDNPSMSSLTDWILAKTPGTVSSDLHPFTTKGGLEGMFSKDRLIAYFAWDGKVLVLTYDLATQKFVNYRTTFEMMLNSLTLEGAPIVPVVLDVATTGPGTLLGTTSTAAVTSTSETPTSETPTSVTPVITDSQATSSEVTPTSTEEVTANTSTAP